jgi:hypothetical protein
LFDAYIPEKNGELRVNFPWLNYPWILASQLKRIVCMKMGVYLMFLFWMTAQSSAQTYTSSVAKSYFRSFCYDSVALITSALQFNPASLASLMKVSIGVVGTRSFLLPELQEANLGIGLPVGTGGFGFGANSSGSVHLRSTWFGMAYAKRLGGKLDIGIQFNYHSLSKSGEKRLAGMGWELGMLIHLSPDLVAGIHCKNIAGAQGGGSQLPLQREYSGGFAYRPSSQFLFCIETDKEEDQPAHVIAVAKYRPWSNIEISAGINAASTNILLGAGLIWNRFRLDICSGYHSQLGPSPTISLHLTGKKNKINQRIKP